MNISLHMPLVRAGPTRLLQFDESLGICISVLRNYINAWNDQCTVDLTGARSRHSTSKFL
jgi:hypothetical protein